MWTDAGPIRPVLTESVMYSVIGTLGLATVVLFWLDRPAPVQGGNEPRALSKFRQSYLVVWSLAIISDWLQGPYVYALYKSYGYSNEVNAMLFIFGFGTSGICGTFIGQFADSKGRKKTALACAFCMMGTCAIKHVNNIYFLVIGRLLGGLATSMVFSVFDSWMVSEHTIRYKFPEAALSKTFGDMQFASSMCAVFAGLMAQAAANLYPLTKVHGSFYAGGYCSPFDVALITAGLSAIAVSQVFTENYGSAAARTETMCQGLSRAFGYLQNRPVWILGALSSIFESSMYLWVFIWTPAITIRGIPEPPYGLLFTSFMISCMIGAKLFGIIGKVLDASQILLLALCVASVTHFAMIQALHAQDVHTMLAEFLIFELAVGLYFPAMGTLKGRIVPEDSRATLYNMYRVPLNVIVVLALMFKAEPAQTLALTSALLSAGTALCSCLLVQGSLVKQPEETRVIDRAV